MSSATGEYRDTWAGDAPDAVFLPRPESAPPRMPRGRGDALGLPRGEEVVRLTRQPLPPPQGAVKHRLLRVPSRRPPDVVDPVELPVRLRGEELDEAPQEDAPHLRRRQHPADAQENLGQKVDAPVPLRPLRHVERPEDVAGRTVQEHRVVVHRRGVGPPDGVGVEAPVRLRERQRGVGDVEEKGVRQDREQQVGEEGPEYERPLPVVRAPVVPGPQRVVDLLRVQVRPQEPVADVLEVDGLRVAELPVHEERRRPETPVAVQLPRRRRQERHHEELLEELLPACLPQERVPRRPRGRLVLDSVHQEPVAALLHEVVHVQRVLLDELVQRHVVPARAPQPRGAELPVTRELHGVAELLHLLQRDDQLLERVLAPRPRAPPVLVVHRGPGAVPARPAEEEERDEKEKEGTPEVPTEVRVDVRLQRLCRDFDPLPT